MDIKKQEASGEISILKFSDAIGTPCSLYVTENQKKLQFELDTDFAQFTREDIAKLLPYLQSFAQTGTLGPTQESPLQGDRVAQIRQKIGAGCSLDMQERIDLLAVLANPPLQDGSMLDQAVKSAASLVRENRDQSKRIEEFKQLAREWRTLYLDGQTLENASQHHLWEEYHDDALYKTAQLLGEEQKPKAVPPTTLQGDNTTEKIYHRALETIRDELTGFDPDGDDVNYDRERACEEVIKVIGIAIGDEETDLQQAGVAINITDQGERIEALQDLVSKQSLHIIGMRNLVKRWRIYAQDNPQMEQSDWLQQCKDITESMLKEAAQLLGEESK